MKLKLLSVIVLALLFVACSEKQQGFSVTNLSDVDLLAKSVIITRAALETKYGEMKEQPLVYLVDESGEKILAQLDDTRGYGKWDQLYTQVDLKVGETRNFTIQWGKAIDYNDVVYRTNIRFADKNDPTKEFTKADRLKTGETNITSTVFQFEGPGWENDVVGFRNYFDARNGIDIWGKKTSEMVLDKVGITGAPSYHEMQVWGMDVLKVGNSLGAGAIALESANELFLVGTGSEGSYKLLSEGPLRSIIEFGFDRVNIYGRLISVKHRISIEAGRPYYNSMVNVDDAGDSRLVTGVVNMESDEVYFIPGNDVSYFFTHGNQAYDGEMLGMAIIVPGKQIEIQTAPNEGEGIIQTFYTTFDIASPTEYYFMAGWEYQDAVYSTFEGFEAAVEKQARQIAAKVDVKI